MIKITVTSMEYSGINGQSRDDSDDFPTGWQLRVVSNEAAFASVATALPAESSEEAVETR